MVKSEIPVKNFLLAAFFLVTWNEYKLNSGDYAYPFSPNGIYTVETITHTIKLATMEDVGKFVGMGNGELTKGTTGYFGRGYGIISKNAFNISIKEIKK